jgi:hypothetical protein
MRRRGRGRGVGHREGPRAEVGGPAHAEGGQAFRGQVEFGGERLQHLRGRGLLARHGGRGQVRRRCPRGYDEPTGPAAASGRSAGAANRRHRSASPTPCAGRWRPRRRPPRGTSRICRTPGTGAHGSHAATRFGRASSSAPVPACGLLVEPRSKNGHRVQHCLPLSAYDADAGDDVVLCELPQVVGPRCPAPSPRRGGRRARERGVSGDTVGDSNGSRAAACGSHTRWRRVRRNCAEQLSRRRNAWKLRALSERNLVRCSASDTERSNTEHLLLGGRGRPRRSDRAVQWCGANPPFNSFSAPPVWSRFGTWPDTSYARRTRF